MRGDCPRHGGARNLLNSAGPLNTPAGWPSAGITVPLCTVVDGSQVLRKRQPETLTELEDISLTLASLGATWEQYCPFTSFQQ